MSTGIYQLIFVRIPGNNSHLEGKNELLGAKYSVWFPRNLPLISKLKDSVLKKAFLKNFAKIIGKHMCRSLF